jgi:hypothetical protein
MPYTWVDDWSKWIGRMTSVTVEQETPAPLGSFFTMKTVILMTGESHTIFSTNTIVPMYSWGRWMGNMSGRIWMTDGRFKCDPAGLLQALQDIYRFKKGVIWK